MLAAARTHQVDESPKRLCFLCVAEGKLRPKAVHSRRVCTAHYQMARRLNVEPAKLLDQMAEPDRLRRGIGETRSRQVSPRITAATYQALQGAVTAGAANSVYRMAARILEEWAKANASTLE